MAVTVIQNTKINTIDFRFADRLNLPNPVPPLVSAKHFTSKDGVVTLKINATLYINSKDSKNPFVGRVKEKKKSLKIYFDYNYDEATPETYDVWYVEIDYTSDNVEKIAKITSYLRDIDPETSRGTTTNLP